MNSFEKEGRNRLLQLPRLIGAIVLSTAAALIAQHAARPALGPLYALPNGWRITPAGRSVELSDMVLKLLPSPDAQRVLALQGGYNAEGVAALDAATGTILQRLQLPAAWLGMAWSPDGGRLYVSGGNGNGNKPYLAPIYVFSFQDGRLSSEPVSRLTVTGRPADVYWAGLQHDPARRLLYAANRGTTTAAGSVVVFDTSSETVVGSIPVEVNPYELALSRDGRTLYVSNWASASVSVVDTTARTLTARIPVDGNPNDMKLASDGRLFVSCANHNSVVVVDTTTRRPVEEISTALFPQAPEGATPNALALDEAAKLLFVANADNNDVAVIDISHPGHSEVLGFIPSGWYPSALAVAGGKLYIGNSRGFGSFPTPNGPGSPLPKPGPGDYSIRGLRRGTISIVSLAHYKEDLSVWTKQVYDNTPYRDALLTRAAAPPSPSVIPQQVGAMSPIEHVVYIIKENRTYDQILGDLPQGDGDARFAIFGREVTPNHHALAEQFVLLDNLYADGEVSAVGHSWSDSAYATDFAEKLWPPTYSGRSQAALTEAYVPEGGHIWDLCRRKGLTYRSYGEYAIQVSGGAQIEAAPGAGALYGHYAEGYRRPGMRDTENAALFLKEFDAYEANFGSSDPGKRMPNFVIMSLPEDHTKGTKTGAFTPRACVASNDYALGQIVDRLSHSRYWPKMAIFIIEDDAQDGPDHVDARRTVGFAISPYIHRKLVDHTQYSTSSILRTIELLLGLPPMSQFDAAATPLYASFGTTADSTPYDALPPRIDLNQKNTLEAYGALASNRMDFADVDRAPMYELNEILWKSIKGADSVMPLPVHRYRCCGPSAPDADDDDTPTASSSRK